MVKLKVLPNGPRPGQLNVITPSPRMKGPLMMGPGVTDLECGKCGFQLVKGLGSQVEGLVLQCPTCRSFNQA